MTKDELIRKAEDALIVQGKEVNLENLKDEIFQGLDQTSYPWPSYKEVKACVDKHQERSA